MSERDAVVITCAVTGVLTNPANHPVPVTTEQMAASCKEAYDAGASVVHLHYRDQRPNMGHLPSWDPAIAAEITEAVRAACPGILINMSTGVMGPDVSGPLACLARLKPEMAACNAGTLNYLKTRRDGSWAWPPMIFDNPVDKVQKMLDGMDAVDAVPEFECFDLGIVRSVGLYQQNGMTKLPHVNFVCGVASGMPADPDLLPLLVKYAPDKAPWQATVIGRKEVWQVHRRAAELGGQLRTGLEDTFYLPDGSRAKSNGQLIETLANIARETGREPATPDQARTQLKQQNS